MINSVVPIKACDCIPCLKESIEDRWHVLAKTEYQINVSYRASQKYFTKITYCKRNSPSWETCFDPIYDRLNLMTLEKVVDALPTEFQENIFFNLDIFR
jgi:hypothetical protein